MTSVLRYALPGCIGSTATGNLGHQSKVDCLFKEGRKDACKCRVAGETQAASAGGFHSADGMQFASIGHRLCSATARGQ